jgi:hypothetical protein
MVVHQAGLLTAQAATSSTRWDAHHENPDAVCGRAYCHHLSPFSPLLPSPVCFLKVATKTTTKPKLRICEEKPKKKTSSSEVKDQIRV